MSRQAPHKPSADQPPIATAPRRLFASLTWRVLLAFLAISALPLTGIGWYVTSELIQVRDAVEAATSTYERRAESIAKRVGDFLRQRERDLERLAELPREEEAYLAFARKRTREVWIRGGTNEKMTEEREKVPLYKEVSFIDLDGREQILVLRGKLMPEARRRDVSDPANTTYRSERYFEAALAKRPGEIHVSQLTGFHVNKFEQLGLEKIISRLEDVDARTKRIYRYLMYAMLAAAGVVEYVDAFEEDARRVLVYRLPGEQERILVDDPGDVSDEELRAREMELNALIDDLAPEDVVEGARYDGVIRFAMPVADSGGRKIGVVSVALDHVHLMQFTQHVRSMEEDAVVFAGYRDANYTYLFDDDGWIITHPKFWNIRGVDRRGEPLPAYTDKTAPEERLVGRAPVNLMQLDWKMGDGYHNVVLEPRKGNTGIASAHNLGGVPRTRIYSPIFYDTGDYAEHGIFGGVMLGTDSHSFVELMRQINAETATRVSKVRGAIRWPLVGIAIAVALLSVVFARRLVRPIRELGAAARRIGEGDLGAPVPTNRRDEIGDLGRSFAEMAASLRMSFDKLERRNRELKAAQAKLLETEQAKQRKLEAEVAELQQEIARSSFAVMVAESPQMKKIQEEVVRVASSSATVLIRGDNGTGKELVAESIHRNSERRDKKFLKVNCAAFNDNLLESEMFGHARGSFTGATGERKGLFESADGGTLLLDEIGDMSLEMQKKLLRTLQEGEIVPLGSNRVVQVDVRLLAATNRDLNLLIERGEFREDLFHRLNVITIQIPPLRERRPDILPLAGLFLQRFADAENKPSVDLAPEAERFLLEYPWPGNVRELQNAMERAVIRSLGNEIRVDDLQLDAPAKRQLPALEEGLVEDWTLAEVEQAYILSVLERNGGNKKLTAEVLGIGYNTLWRKLKKYDS